MSDCEDPTKPATKPATDPVTDPATDPVIDPVSDPVSDPVGAAQTDAAQAQADADKALADPQADLNQLLDGLRSIEIQLYGIEVVQQVQQLSGDDKQEFVAARLHLTSVINQLNTAQLSDIAESLEKHSAELRTGIQALGKSLGNLTAASSWASALNSIIGVVGQIIPLI